jgi:ribosomal protein S18 acetylase RimI-like enzyme
MTIEMGTPTVDDLEEVVAQLGLWQRTGAPVQLHPGDLGWFSLRGEEALAARLRVWRRDRSLVAMGLLDEPTVLRLAIAPEVEDDAEVAEAMADHLGEPAAGVLPPGESAVEARAGAALRALLPRRGWVADDPWVPLRLDLTEEPADLASEHGVRVEIVDGTDADDWFAVHAAAFGGRGGVYWEPLRDSIPFRRGTCLLARDSDGAAAACVAAWSAGAGRPGLIEPLGVHPDHRRRGLARVMNAAASRALRSMGSSEVVVCTPQSQTGAVEAYVASGFSAEQSVTDFVRR